MIQTMRWYGPSDPISLAELVQTGISGVVTALHHVPNGDVWSVEEITERKLLIEQAGLSWDVVESVPVHEDIKKRKGNYKTYIDNYKQTLRNLAHCGIHMVCYNFMPILDWSRTQVDWQFADGSTALRFEMKVFAAFDIFILQRQNAAASYTQKIVAEATAYYNSMDDKAKQKLADTILLGLPGSEMKYTMDEFRATLKEYEDIDAAVLKQNLFLFLKEIIPIASEVRVSMGIHPDDPPFSLFGLPRVVGTHKDLHEIITSIDSIYNGLTFCTGSLGAAHFNNCVALAKAFAHRVNFLHLRNVWRDEDGNFYEDNHLDGSTDMYDVMKTFVLEEKKRMAEGRHDHSIPMRPDHGHQMLDDLKKTNHPGYSLIGRLKGLAELRGLEYGIRRTLA